MRILIVDDDVELVGLLRYALETAGYEVVVAYDGEQALAVFEQTGPDLVVLDVNLPGIDGFGVLEKLRRDSDIPVMMLTVRADEADEVRGLDLGADDYLRKPFSPRALLARVRALLRRGSDGAEPVRVDPEPPAPTAAPPARRCPQRSGCPRPPPSAAAGRPGC